MGHSLEHVKCFSAVNILICWPDRAIALAWCVQQRLATGCIGLAVFISSRALSLNYSYNYSIYKEATENMLNKRHSLHTVRQLVKPHLT